MARQWLHIDESTGLWAEWVKDTLPSRISTYNRHFLNQFVAWEKYLVHCQVGLSGEGVFVAPDFIEAGQNLQPKTFWNALRFFPSGGAYPDFTNILLGWGYGVAADDWKTAGTYAGYNQSLNASDDYGDHPVDEIVDSAYLHPTTASATDLESWLACLRWRLDNCEAFHSYAGIIASVRSYEWSENSGYTQTSPPAEWTDSTATPYILRTKDSNNRHVTVSPAVSGIGIYAEAQCSASIYFTRSIGSTATDYIPSVPYPIDGSAEVVAHASALPSLNLIASEIPAPADIPVYSDTEDFLASDGMIAYIPHDEIPDDFLPPDGLPIENDPAYPT